MVSFTGDRLRKDCIAFQDALFQEKPPRKFSCPICLAAVQREAHLTGCCGNHFCRQCIMRLANNRRPCPMCKTTSLSIFPNKERQREINALRMRCPFNLLSRSCKDIGGTEKEEGVPDSLMKNTCVWMGELGDLEDHLETHPFDLQRNNESFRRRNEMTGEFLSASDDLPNSHGPSRHEQRAHKDGGSS